MDGVVDADDARLGDRRVLVQGRLDLERADSSSSWRQLSERSAETRASRSSSGGAGRSSGMPSISIGGS
jgi:hypothetical protein